MGDWSLETLAVYEELAGAPEETGVRQVAGLHRWERFAALGEWAAGLKDAVEVPEGLRVTLPLLRPGLGAGAALVFHAVATELTATLLLAPTGTTTLATEFWSASSELRYGAAAPYALLLVLVSIPATVLLMRVDSPATRTETIPV